MMVPILEVVLFLPHLDIPIDFKNSTLILILISLGVISY